MKKVGENMKYNQKGLGFIINELKKNTIIEKGSDFEIPKLLRKNIQH